MLEFTGWRVSGTNGAAEVLGLRPTTLEARMKKLGITRPVKEYRAASSAVSPIANGHAPVYMRRAI